MCWPLTVIFAILDSSAPLLQSTSVLRPSIMDPKCIYFGFVCVGHNGLLSKIKLDKIKRHKDVITYVGAFGAGLLDVDMMLRLMVMMFFIS